jgi:ribosome-associated protein
MQYIGKLMRRVDADAIRAVLVVDDDRHRAETAIMHAAERWRDALIVEPGRLTEFVGKYPVAALRNLHPMIRSAATEVSRAQHGRHYRELFRELRDIMIAELGQGDGGDAADDSDA